MEILRKILLSKYVGLFVRYSLTIIGAFMVSHGMATPDQVADANQEAMAGITRLVSSPEFQEAIGSLLITIGAIAAGIKAKFVDAKNETKLLDHGILPVKH